MYTLLKTPDNLYRVINNEKKTITAQKGSPEEALKWADFEHSTFSALSLIVPMINESNVIFFNKTKEEFIKFIETTEF